MTGEPTYALARVASLSEYDAINGSVALWLCSECGAWVGAQIKHTEFHSLVEARRTQ